MNDLFTDWAWPWWSIMVLINVVNLALCCYFFFKSREQERGDDSFYLKSMRIMGVIFVLVGAYRSVFVSRYISQMAWFDSIANSSLLIRTFATFAELSFAGLIAFAMLRVNKDLEIKASDKQSSIAKFMIEKSPYVLFVSIFLAQFFATSGVITKSRTLFAIEETLWTIGFLSVLPLGIIQLLKLKGVKNIDGSKNFKLVKRFSKINLGWIIIYASYGLFFHLPFENWPGAINQIQTGLPEIKTGISAIVDAFTIVNESKLYSDWGFGFLLWHSAYFTICVWIAIFLMQAPRVLTVDKE